MAELQHVRDHLSVPGIDDNFLWWHCWLNMCGRFVLICLFFIVFFLIFVFVSSLYFLSSFGGHIWHLALVVLKEYKSLVTTCIGVD